MDIASSAKKVIVTDVSCNDPRRCFARSGIAVLAEQAGAEVQLPEDRKFRRINTRMRLQNQVKKTC